MIEFWNNLSWAQAFVMVMLGIPALVVLFFIFGGEISFSGETKDKLPKDMPEKIKEVFRDK